MMLLLAYIISSILDDLGDSAFNFNFISLPYLDDEDLELFNFEDGHLHNLWLLPITESKRNCKIENG